MEIDELNALLDRAVLSLQVANPTQTLISRARTLHPVYLLDSSSLIEIFRRVVTVFEVPWILYSAPFLDALSLWSDVISYSLKLQGASAMINQPLDPTTIRGFIRQTP